MGRGGASVLKKIAIGVLALLGLATVVLYVIGLGALGRHEGPGKATLAPRPEAVVVATSEAVMSGRYWCVCGKYGINRHPAQRTVKGNAVILHHPADFFKNGKGTVALV